MKKIMLSAQGSGEQGWNLDRRLNMSAILELLCLASLIIGSWFNLQQNITFLQRDVQSLIESQKTMNEKMQTLGERTIGLEYRISAIEANNLDLPDRSKERTNHYE